MEEFKYTPKEEFMNAFTHAMGALFSIYAIVMLAVSSATPVEAASTSIFGATLFLLFQSSTLYHAMVNETAKKVFRKIDHSAIFVNCGYIYSYFTIDRKISAFGCFNGHDLVLSYLGNNILLSYSEI